MSLTFILDKWVVYNAPYVCGGCLLNRHIDIILRNRLLKGNVSPALFVWLVLLAATAKIHSEN
jgi:hypothetical protein